METEGRLRVADVFVGIRDSRQAPIALNCSVFYKTHAFALAAEMVHAKSADLRLHWGLALILGETGSAE